MYLRNLDNLAICGTPLILQHSSGEQCQESDVSAHEYRDGKKLLLGWALIQTSVRGPRKTLRGFPSQVFKLEKCRKRTNRQAKKRGTRPGSPARAFTFRCWRNPTQVTSNFRTSTGDPETRPGSGEARKRTPAVFGIA